MVGLLSLSETKELQGEDLVTYLKIRYILCTRRKKNIHNEMSHGGLLYVQKFSFEESHAATCVILLLTKLLLA
jgi:hypothetical protein